MPQSISTDLIGGFAVSEHDTPALYDGVALGLHQAGFVLGTARHDLQSGYSASEPSLWTRPHLPTWYVSFCSCGESSSAARQATPTHAEVMRGTQNSHAAKRSTYGTAVEPSSNEIFPKSCPGVEASPHGTPNVCTSSALRGGGGCLFLPHSLFEACEACCVPHMCVRRQFTAGHACPEA